MYSDTYPDTSQINFQTANPIFSCNSERLKLLDNSKIEGLHMIPSTLKMSRFAGNCFRLLIIISILHCLFEQLITIFIVIFRARWAHDHIRQSLLSILSDFEHCSTTIKDLRAQ